MIYDIEMMWEMGYINGIENYFCYMDWCKFGEFFFIFLDFFFKDFLLIVDELY